jgi:molybdate transport repressor ModE-like protein
LRCENSKGQAVMEEGVASLLRAIERRKCISLARKDIGISYRCALHRIRMAEKRSGTKLVRRFRGGGEKGGSELTEHCRLLVQRYFDAKRLLQRTAKSMWV